MDIELLDGLLANLRPRLVRRAVQLGAGDDREDWAQEALVHIWTLAQRRAPTATGYLWTAGVHRMVDLARRRQREHRLIVMSLEALPTDGSAVFAAPVPEEPPDLRALLVVLRQSVSGQMLLHHADGMLLRQIASRHSIPMGTVKSRLNMGRRIARRELATLCPDVAHHYTPRAMVQ